MSARLQPVEMAAKQTELEHACEAEQREAEYVHLVVHRARCEDQTDQAEYGHQQPDDQVALIEVHGMLR